MSNTSEFIKLATCFAGGQRAGQAFGAWMDYQKSLRSGKPILRHFPPALMIEPTNICNLKCPMCPSGNGSLTRSRGYMPFERYERIIKQVYKKIGVLMLWNQGESFLNPRFYDMLELAGRMGLFTIVSTNASLPLDVDALGKMRIGKLIVSMDGISKETYDRYRVNGDHELVLKNLERLAQQEKLKEALVWQFIVMRHNEAEIPQLKTKAKEMGIKRVELKTMQIYLPEDVDFLPQNPMYSRYKIQKGSFEIKTTILNRCRRLWLQPVINQDGEFSICCYDKDLSIKIGNIDKASFEELWLGSRMMQMRSQVLNNRALVPICTNCGEGIVQRIT